jgi:hypothetical protein
MGNKSREGEMAAVVPSSVLTEEANTSCVRGTRCGRGRRMRGERRGRRRVDGGKSCGCCRFGPAAAAMACRSLRACCLLSCIVKAGLLNGRWSSPCRSERGRQGEGGGRDPPVQICCVLRPMGFGARLSGREG